VTSHRGRHETIDGSEKKKTRNRKKSITEVTIGGLLCHHCRLQPNHEELQKKEMHIFPILDQMWEEGGRNQANQNTLSQDQSICVIGAQGPIGHKRPMQCLTLPLGRKRKKKKGETIIDSREWCGIKCPQPSGKVTDIRHLHLMRKEGVNIFESWGGKRKGGKKGVQP